MKIIKFVTIISSLFVLLLLAGCGNEELTQAVSDIKITTDERCIGIA